jgi:hypothetical protein
MFGSLTHVIELSVNKDVWIASIPVLVYFPQIQVSCWGIAIVFTYIVYVYVCRKMRKDSVQVS